MQCAVEIEQAAIAEGLQLRMGAHSGPVKEVRDVNDRPNFAGAGINIAQRVLDCGDAGHILISERIAEDLRPYAHWHSAVHDIGICEVKHAVQLRVFSVCKQGVGNPEIPGRIRTQRRWSQRVPRAAWRLAQKAPLRVTLFILIVLTLVSLASERLFFRRASLSIAVLPFRNLSEEKGNANFADGLVSEITTKLENVHQFEKVISHTSVRQYKPEDGRAAREIAAELKVTHLLEGSVQRINDHIRVQAQLIDARADKLLLGQQYDNDAGDMFAIQTDICQDIVDRLKLRLSGHEKSEIEATTKTSALAQQQYARAAALITSAVFSARPREELNEAAQLLERAITEAPDFARAYYQLAHVQDQIYHRSERTPERLRKAEEAIMALQRLAPNSGETHLARAKHLYWALADYDAAMDQLTMALPSLPNESVIPQLKAYILRRRSDWNGSYAEFARALELNPRDPSLLQQLALSYFNQRRFGEMAEVLDQAIKIAPEDLVLRAQRSAVDLEWRADPRPLHEFIASVLATGLDRVAPIADQWFDLAMRERDPRTAAQALSLLAQDGCQYENIPFPRSWCEGRAASLAGDRASAEKHYAESRAAAETLVRIEPNFGGAWCVLALADAALGHKDEAIKEGKRAAELLPVNKDALNGPVILGYLAIAYGWLGETNQAMDELQQAVSVPSYWSYGHLALHPDWDSLRGDPRFAQILASLAPKQ